jgi:hypothetical protein
VTGWGIVLGGTGGSGPNGSANGGAAVGNMSATSAASSASVTATGQATGGYGGNLNTTNAAAQAGDGASATSTTTAAALADSQAQSVDNARGGDGGQVFDAGLGGAGGNASSTANASSAGPTYAAFAQANATGGSGTAPLSGLAGGVGGDALALASAVNPLGTASASAYAQGGVGGGSALDGRAVARTHTETTAYGQLVATGSATGGPITSLLLTMSQLGVGVMDGEARASVGLAEALDLTGLEGAAFGAGMPLSQDIQAALAGNPNAIDALAGTTALALGLLGGGSSPSGGGDSNAYGLMTASIDLSQVSVLGSLKIAFLDPVATGDVSNVSLSIVREGVLAYSQQFSSTQSILAFFDDGVLDLGNPLIGLSGDLDLQIQLQVFAAPGQSFFTDFVVAVVPEPGVVALLAAPALGLALRRRRRDQQAPRSGARSEPQASGVEQWSRSALDTRCVVVAQPESVS